MGQLVDVFSFVSETIYKYLTTLNSHWYTQVCMYTVLLGIVVSVILYLRR